MAASRENRVLVLLEKYTQGLTIDDVTKALGISRTTASKDLEVLVATGKIKRRETGKSKLHYLPKYFKEIKFAIIFLLSGFFVFNLFTTDGIAILHFNYIFQAIFMQAIQIILIAAIAGLVGIFAIYKISNKKLKKLVPFFGIVLLLLLIPSVQAVAINQTSTTGTNVSIHGGNGTTGYADLNVTNATHGQLINQTLSGFVCATNQCNFTIIVDNDLFNMTNWTFRITNYTRITNVLYNASDNTWRNITELPFLGQGDFWNWTRNSSQVTLVNYTLAGGDGYDNGIRDSVMPGSYWIDNNNALYGRINITTDFLKVALTENELNIFNYTGGMIFNISLNTTLVDNQNVTFLYGYGTQNKTVYFFDWMVNDWKVWFRNTTVAGGNSTAGVPDWLDPRFKHTLKVKYQFRNDTATKPEVNLTFLITAVDPFVRIFVDTMNATNSARQNISIPVMLGENKNSVSVAVGKPVHYFVTSGGKTEQILFVTQNWRNETRNFTTGIPPINFTAVPDVTSLYRINFTYGFNSTHNRNFLLALGYTDRVNTANFLPNATSIGWSSAENLEQHANSTLTWYDLKDSRLVGWWKLNEGSGTVTADGSDNNNTGVLNTNVSWVTNSTCLSGFGYCLSFNGSFNNITVTDSNSLDIGGDKLTVTAWINLRATGAQAVVRKPVNAYNLSFDSSTLPTFYVRTSIGNGVISDTVAPPTNAWIHIAGVYDGNTLRIFVNGSERASVVHNGTVFDTSQNLIIGSNDWTGNNLNALVDNIKIFSRALTAEEILWEYQQQKENYPNWFKADKSSTQHAKTLSFNYGAGSQTIEAETGLLTSGLLRFTDTSASNNSAIVDPPNGSAISNITHPINLSVYFHGGNGSIGYNDVIVINLTNETLKNQTITGYDCNAGTTNCNLTIILDSDNYTAVTNYFNVTNVTNLMVLYNASDNTWRNASELTFVGRGRFDLRNQTPNNTIVNYTIAGSDGYDFGIRDTAIGGSYWIDNNNALYGRINISNDFITASLTENEFRIFNTTNNLLFNVSFNTTSLDNVTLTTRYTYGVQNKTVYFFDWKVNDWKVWFRNTSVAGGNLTAGVPDWADPRFKQTFKFRYQFWNNSLPNINFTFLMTAHDPFVRIFVDSIDPADPIDGFGGSSVDSIKWGHGQSCASCVAVNSSYLFVGPSDDVSNEWQRVWSRLGFTPNSTEVKFYLRLTNTLSNSPNWGIAQYGASSATSFRQACRFTTTDTSNGDVVASTYTDVTKFNLYRIVLSGTTCTFYINDSQVGTKTTGFDTASVEAALWARLSTGIVVDWAYVTPNLHNLTIPIRLGENKAAVTATSLEDGLVGYWTFDEGSGNVSYDSSGNANHGSFTTDPTWTNTRCIFGNCLNFTSGTPFVNIGNPPSLNLTGTAITVAAWVNKVSSQGQTPNGVVAKNDVTGDRGWYLHADHSGGGIQATARFRLENVSNSVGTATTPEGEILQNRWYFLVGRYNGTGVSIFVNGTERASAALTGPILNNTVNVVIGRYYSNTGPYYFNGTIDDVRIYDRALSNSEIQQLYENKSLQKKPAIYFLGNTTNEEVLFATTNMRHAFRTLSNSTPSLFNITVNPAPLRNILLYNYTFNSTLNNNFLFTLGTVGKMNTAKFTSLNQTGFSNETIESLTNSTLTFYDLRDYSLVGWWKLNEGSGAAINDSSGFGNNGTIINNVTWITNSSCKLGFGPCLFFGRNDNSYASVGNSTNFNFGTGDFAIVFWMRTSAINNFNIISKVVAAGTTGWYFDMSGSTGILNIRANNAVITTSGSKAVNDNVWHNVVVTRSGVTTYLYVDGTRVGSGAHVSDDNTIEPLVFSDDPTGPNFYNGTLDNVKIYRRALSADEVFSDYLATADSYPNWAKGSGNTTHPGTTVAFNYDGGAAGIWHLDEGAGVNVTGVGGNWNNTGFLNGSVWITNSSCKYGSCLFFDGVDDRIVVGNENNFQYGTGDFTWEAWAKTIDKNTQNAILGHWNCGGTTDAILLTINTNGFTCAGAADKITLVTRDGSTERCLTSDTSANDGAWHHIAGLRQGQSLKVYIDGKLNAQINNLPGGYALDPTGGLVISGGCNLNGEYPWNGTLDEIRIYPRALTDYEVWEHYSREVSKYYDDFNTVGAAGSGRYRYFGVEDSNTTLQPITPKDTVLHLRFNDNSTTNVTDLSGYQNNGRTASSAIWVTNSTCRNNFGGCMGFDGTNDYVEIPDSDSLDFSAYSSFTIAGWFRTDASSAQSELLVMKQPADSGGFNVYRPSNNVNKLRFELVGSVSGGPSVDSTPSINDNNWHFFAGARDNATDTLFLYIDNNTRDSTTDTSVGTFANSGNLRIGANTGLTVFFNGTIDEIMIINRSLSSDEVYQLYVGGFNRTINNRTHRVASADGITTVAYNLTDHDSADADNYDQIKLLINGTFAAEAAVATKEVNARYNFTAPLNSTYKVWIRALNNSATATNELSVSVDGSRNESIIVTTSTYSWYPTNVTALLNGVHNLTIAFESGNVTLDVAVITSDLGFIPAGLTNMPKVGNSLYVDDFNVGFKNYTGVEDSFSNMQAPTFNDTVLQLRFNDNSTTNVTDVSGYQNNGRTASGAIWITNSTCRNNFGGCMGFDGSNDFVQVASSRSIEINGSLTYAFWFLARDTDLNDRLFRKQTADTTSGIEAFITSTPGIRFNIKTTDCTSETILTNRWYQAALTYDGTNLRCYLNASLQATVAAGAGMTNTTLDLFIGAESASTTYPFNGLIDEFIIINRSLTADEVYQLYLGGFNRTIDTNKTHRITDVDSVPAVYYNLSDHDSATQHEYDQRKLLIVGSLPEGIVDLNASSGRYKRGDMVNITFNVSSDIVQIPNVSFTLPNGSTRFLQIHNESTAGLYKTNYTFASYDPVGGYVVNVTDDTYFRNATNATLNNTIVITLESTKMTDARRIVSRVNQDVYTFGRAYYASDSSSVNSTQMNASFETSAGVTLLGTNNTNSSGDYMFTFRFTYPINFTYIVAINDTNNNQGRNTTTVTYVSRVLFAKFVNAYRIGTSKTNDAWRLGTATLWNFTVGSSDPNTRMDASNLTLPYICTYDQAQYSDGIFVSLIHTGDKGNLEYVNFSNVASNDFYRTELKQNADGSSTLLAFGKGNCADVDSRLSALSGQTVPNVPIGTYTLGEVSETEVQISLQYDRLLLNGTDRFTAGNNKLCVKNVKITTGNEPLIDVRRC